jgi:hypothetical protein
VFIAFEGPDNAGKSTSAAHLTSFESPVYNATKENHRRAQTAMGNEAATLVQAFDRIDWLTHMVYRLALPDREWNDDRVRTVFAMPDTHLVFKIHRPDLAHFTADEVVDTPISKVNPMYYHVGTFLATLNDRLDYTLFRTVSFVEVANEGESYQQELKAFYSPVNPLPIAPVTTDEELLELLRYDEHTRL